MQHKLQDMHLVKDKMGKQKLFLMVTVLKELVAEVVDYMAALQANMRDIFLIAQELAVLDISIQR